MSTQPHPLPKARSHLTSLFASFPQKSPHPNNPPPSQPPNPLLSAPSAIKPLLLTLHVLFPNELLPALDLLDRKLVTRLVPAQDEENGLNEQRSGDDGDGANENPVNVKGKTRMVYYVRSSQQPRFHRFASATSRSYDALSGSGMCYEVRLKAWNCSCPAFAFAGVACLGNGMGGGLVIDGGGGGGGLEGFMGGNGDESGDRGGSRGFGGLIRGEGEVPVCKHLLACYLAESWSGFGGCVEERVVGKEEMSGWAAGWGG